MKKMLFIDHAFHEHTKSAEFIKELFVGEYTIDVVYLDPGNIHFPEAFQKVNQKHYDVMIVWQLMPSLSWLKNYVSWDKVAFSPMYDGIPALKDIIWQEYKNTKIISFSKTLYSALKIRGFDVKYIQYFPRTQDVTNWGSDDSIFYWQRVHNLPIQSIVDTIKNSISKIHIHTSLDPHHHAVDIVTDKEVTRSKWFDTKEEMYAKILESSLYVAPRLSEGIGMSFLEAMSMGRCVIAVNYPTMNEYIKNGKTGFLYDLNDVSKLKIENVRKIQENTLQYMQTGYKQWEKNKKKISKWIQSSVRSSKINKQFSFFIFGKIPLFHWRKIK